MPQPQRPHPRPSRSSHSPRAQTEAPRTLRRGNRPTPIPNAFPSSSTSVIDTEMPSSRLRIFHRHRATHNSSPTPKDPLPPDRQIPHRPMPLPAAERLGIPPFSEMPLPHHPAFALTAREPKRNPKAHRPGHASPEPVRPTKTRLAAAGRRRHQAGPRAAGGPRLGGCAFTTKKCLFRSKPRALTHLKNAPKNHPH